MLLLLCTGVSSAQDTPEQLPSAASGELIESALTEEAIEPRPGTELDWVPIKDVPKRLQNLSCRLCKGRYIDPQGANTGKNPDTAPINARAKSTELEGNTVRLSGGVEVTQGYREFSSDEASINRETRAGTLEGNIELREPGVLLRGERGEFYSQSGEAQMENSRFVLHEQPLRGSASLLTSDGN